MNTLTTYPATETGAWDLLDHLSNTIRERWKTERKNFNTDDLVVVIYTRNGQISFNHREVLYGTLNKTHPELGLLEHLKNKPATQNGHGTIKIWVLIDFTEQRVCLLPFRLAES